jgi:uncharacterized membrane protein
MSTASRALSVVLVVLLVVSVSGLVYISLAPVKTTEPHTALYVLNESGGSGSYLENLSVGESGTVVVGVENYEGEETTYTLVGTVESETVVSETVTLANEETWRRDVAVSFDSPGRKHVVFSLYRGDSPQTAEDPYRWVEVNATVVA